MRNEIHRFDVNIFLMCLALVACSPEGRSPAETPTATPPPLPAARKVATIPDAENVRLLPIVEGFVKPLFLTHAGDGSGRLFVLEQAGLIRIIQDGEILAEPFLDVSHLADWQFYYETEFDYSENGLLGMAFHPEYPENGLFFINYTDQLGDTVLARYRVSADDPNRADPDSATVILTVDQPHAFHNAGMLAFGPDGYLYAGLGDGGEGYLALNSQFLINLLGSIIRIDARTDDPAGYTIPADNPFVGKEFARPEIWAYGLRNPWRFSFDRATGDLWIGDVGQSTFEEVNYQPASSAGGENYGWPYWEALKAGPGAIPLEETSIPAFYYSREHGVSITAGYVYRGEAIEDLYGVFIFGDFGTGRIWSFYRREDGGWQVNEYMKTDHIISSFGEDEGGEIYLVDYRGGSIWKFTPRQ